MTIREVEAKTGLERASIRFYEQQGLLSPRRGDNGYRDYSEEDLTTLERVRFLRSLGFGVQEIRAFQTGERALDDALPGRIHALNLEKAERERACRICEEMHADHASYQTLQAEKYLSASDRPRVQTPTTDVLPPVRSPWKRFFARMLDAGLAAAVFWSLFMLIFRVSPTRMNGVIWDAAQWLVWLLMLVALEPVCLHLFGTTPGKAILGLRVESANGGRLTVRAARERTWEMLWYGEGANLPVYGLVRSWKSFKACLDGDGLPWEQGSVLVEQPMRAWRGLVYMAATALCLGMFVFCGALAGKPPCSGELTVAQYARNYNTVADYCGDEGGRLDEESGQWLEPGLSANSFTIEVIAPLRREIEYDLREDGTIRRVTWRYQADGGEELVSLPEEELFLAAVAFAGANEFRPYYRALSAFSKGGLEGGTLQYGDTLLTRTVSGSENLQAIGGGLYMPAEGASGRFTLEVTQGRNAGNVREAAFLKKAPQTVKNPRRAREGRNPLELSIVPSGVYGGHGTFFAPENLIFQSKNRFLAVFAPGNLLDFSKNW